MIDLRCEYLSVRYSLKLQILRLFRGRPSLTFRELKSVYSLWNENMKNNTQGIHFLGAIKIVTTMIHYCYGLMAYGKWRSVTWYRMINITFFLRKNVSSYWGSFFSWNCMPGLGYSLKYFAFERNYFWKSYF